MNWQPGLGSSTKLDQAHDHPITGEKGCSCGQCSRLQAPFEGQSGSSRSYLEAPWKKLNCFQQRSALPPSPPRSSWTDELQPAVGSISDATPQGGQSRLSQAARQVGYQLRRYQRGRGGNSLVSSASHGEAKKECPPEAKWDKTTRGTVEMLQYHCILWLSRRIMGSITCVEGISKDFFFFFQLQLEEKHTSTTRYLQYSQGTLKLIPSLSPFCCDPSPLGTVVH